MEYFELFDIPVTLKAPPAGLTEKYFALQKRYHPDLFAQSSQAEQATALELSSKVNRAFKVLSHPDETIRYVLTRKGLLQEEEKYALSPGFLMEMMELNEQLAEADDESSLAPIHHSIHQFKNDIYESVEAIITNYQEGITSEKELLQVKDYYFKKKYLDRLGANR